MNAINCGWIFQITQIEEQQKAIIKLKVGMMDDMNDKGILSTQAIEQILRNHEQVCLLFFLLLIIIPGLFYNVICSELLVVICLTN